MNPLRVYKTGDPSWTNLFMLGLSSCFSLTAASLFSRASSPSKFVPRSEVGSVSACEAADGQHNCILYRNNKFNIFIYIDRYIFFPYSKGCTKMNLWILLESIWFGIAVNCLHALRLLMLVWALFCRTGSFPTQHSPSTIMWHWLAGLVWLSPKARQWAFAPLIFCLVLGDGAKQCCYCRTYWGQMCESVFLAQHMLKTWMKSTEAQNRMR